MSFDVLQDRIRELKNPTVAGLDPRIEYVPAHLQEESFAQFGQTLEGAADAIWKFNQGLIDALCDVVPAVKPQSAYYENLGWRGMAVMEKTIQYAKEKGLYVIADIKRGDIGSTAAAYAEAWLGVTKVGETECPVFDADCVTLNGYMGSDAIKPFLDQCVARSKSAFILAKTSNPSSMELQDMVAGDRVVYTVMGDLIERWGKDTAGKYGTTPWVPWWAPHTPPCSRSCAVGWSAPSSWCPAMGPRGAPLPTCATPLTSWAGGPSSTPPAPSCAPGRRPAKREWTTRRPPGTLPFGCGTS